MSSNNFNPFSTKVSVPAHYRQVEEITIVEQEGRNSLGLAAQALLDHVEQRCLGFVAPDVVHFNA